GLICWMLNLNMIISDIIKRIRVRIAKMEWKSVLCPKRLSIGLDRKGNAFPIMEFELSMSGEIEPRDAKRMFSRLRFTPLPIEAKAKQNWAKSMWVDEVIV
ncbi:MAG: hypothetical protein ABDI07_08835, partial [Candidatus Kryptonium sp.]